MPFRVFSTLPTPVSSVASGCVRRLTPDGLASAHAAWPVTGGGAGAALQPAHGGIVCRVGKAVRRVSRPSASRPVGRGRGAGVSRASRRAGSGERVDSESGGGGTVVLVRSRVGPAAGTFAAGDCACEGATAVAGGVEPGGSARRVGAATGRGAPGGIAVVRFRATVARVFELASEGRGLSPRRDPRAGREGGSGPCRAVAGARAG